MEMGNSLATAACSTRTPTYGSSMRELRRRALIVLPRSRAERSSGKVREESLMFGLVPRATCQGLPELFAIGSLGSLESVPAFTHQSKRTTILAVLVSRSHIASGAANTLHERRVTFTTGVKAFCNTHKLHSDEQCAFNSAGRSALAEPLVALTLRYTTNRAINIQADGRHG